MTPVAIGGDLINGLAKRGKHMKRIDRPRNEQKERSCVSSMRNAHHVRALHQWHVHERNANCSGGETVCQTMLGTDGCI